MLEILTAEEMKKIDAAAVAGGVAHLSLIEAAGGSLAHIIMENLAQRPVLVLCGAGNNGADGFIAAQQLKKNGWPVRVACLVKKTALKNDAALAAQKWDGETEMLNSNLSLKDAGLVVDAVFGTGFRGALDPELVTCFDKIRAKKIPAVAADVPSGMNATSGEIAAGALQPDITVAFCRKKIAHVLQPARAFCGKIAVAAISGIGDDTVAAQNTPVFENHPGLWLKNFPVPGTQSHKYSRGHAVVFGGSLRTGAACLAAAAAQKIGAGLVTLTSKPENRVLYAGYRASILVDSWQSIDDLKTILRDERKNAFVIGPGAGDDAKEATLAMLGFNKSGVLDADVFTAFKSAPQELFAKLSSRHVLTPHEGEFERLFGVLGGSKLDRARAAARQSNAVILLKGPDTVIAAPDGTAIINTNAPPNLATAGSGDVLAGFIAGLCAQGMPPFMAASAACWLHAETARAYGFGLTAEDIISQLPQILNTLFSDR